MSLDNYYGAILPCRCCGSDRHFSIHAMKDETSARRYIIGEALRSLCPHCTRINEVEAELIGMGVPLGRYYRNVYIESLIVDKLKLFLAGKEKDFIWKVTPAVLNRVEEIWTLGK
jgi:hypothetical protein